MNNSSSATLPSAGRSSGAPGNELYCRPAVRQSKTRRSSTGCGWYEHGVYDVAIALTEVPLKPYELEYRDRTVFSPTEPPPVELPSNLPPPVVLKVKPKTKAFAPPHPSTVMLCYEPPASRPNQPAPLELTRQGSVKKAVSEKAEKPSKSHDKAEKHEAAEGHSKEERKKDKSEKAEKSDKADKHSKEKHEKHKKDRTSKETSSAETHAKEES